MRRQSLICMLQSHPDLEVVGEISDGNEVMKLSGTLSPDVVLVDQLFPLLNQLDPVVLIHQWNPSQRVLILSDSLSPQAAIRSLQSGATGYVVRYESFDSLIVAIHDVVNGRRYISAMVADQILDTVISGKNFEPATDARISNREREILRLIAEGKTNSEIGNLLVISTRTVETHRKNLQAKLGLTSQGEMIRYAIKHGILSID